MGLVCTLLVEANAPVNAARTPRWLGGHLYRALLRRSLSRVDRVPVVNFFGTYVLYPVSPREIRISVSPRGPVYTASSFGRSEMRHKDGDNDWSFGDSL